MSQLALFMLGPPRLELDEAPVHISRRKAMALLAYLAVTAQPHSRDSLAALLWPENDHSSARAGLRRTLSSLNLSLGGSWLQADRENVCLNIRNDPSESRSFWLDVADFQGKLKVTESHNHPPTATCPDCLPALEEAVALYTDDFMAGFSLKDCPAYDEWQFFQTEEFRSQLAKVLMHLSSHFAELKDFEPAIQHARRWLSLDPLHEPAHQQLMNLYEYSGQRAAALRQYQTCREVLSEELGVEPSQETKGLYQQIKGSTLISLPESRPKSNLPAQPTPFIGRETELAEIRAKLKDPDCCLLTLLGPGGSGKTRLAIQAARGLVGDFKHGVFFVNLAPLEDAAKIPSTVAEAINFTFSEGGTPEEQLLDYLRSKEMFLILDNFEHLIQGAKFVTQTISSAPNLKILTTSHTRLMVTREHIFPVTGMAYPELSILDQLDFHRYSALKLFESEASRVQTDFKLSVDNLSDVIQVCALLEGMPLGIVLAANWVRALPLPEIAEEIILNLDLLEANMGDLPQRQRSLRSVFNHSWQLLSEREREIFMALSVFRGGFTRETAYEVASSSLKDLMRLLNKSILHRTTEDRFEIHELLRQYAAEKLAKNPPLEDEVRGKHCKYYCQALAVWERKLEGPEQFAIIQAVSLEIDNIRAAWNYGLKITKVKLLFCGINGLFQFFSAKDMRLEGDATCRILIDKLSTFQESDIYRQGGRDLQIKTQKLQARAFGWGIKYSTWAGDTQFASELAKRFFRYFQTKKETGLDLRFERALALTGASWTLDKNSQSKAIKMTEESAQIFRSLDEPWHEALSLYFLGLHTRSISRVESIKNFEKCLAISRKYGNLKSIAETLQVLSEQISAHGEYDRAEGMLEESLSIYKDPPNYERIVVISIRLYEKLVWQGKFREAQRLTKDILAIYQDRVNPQSYASVVLVRLGFADQHLGEYDSVRTFAQYHFERMDVVKDYWANWGKVSAMTILGNIALTEGAPGEAAKLFHQCIQINQSYHLIYYVFKAMLGYSAREMNQMSEAQDFLYQALTLSRDKQDFISLVHTLPGIALLFADQGDTERAVELYALASTQGIVANSKWFADIAGDEIAAAAEELPAEVMEAAKERGRSLDLWDTAVDLLQELDAMGWKKPSNL